MGRIADAIDTVKQHGLALGQGPRSDPPRLGLSHGRTVPPDSEDRHDARLAVRSALLEDLQAAGLGHDLREEMRRP
ncbi:hypothetical protein [Bradyrhizobium sp. WSM3983]|uniref:hypothetical protein n=1 Tax=Bradyrhizobium sp. WSM3983 TaxID=1038867 RepID=UPI0012EB215C|nr:hypothetical protein [Bradyrhizobium sp. WSM3983]